MVSRTDFRPGTLRLLAVSAAGTALLAAALAGCAPSGPFSGPAMATPPPAVMASGDVVDGTVRLMGTDDEGVQYFVFKTTPDDETCLMVLPPSNEGARGCSAALPITLMYGEVRAVLNEVPVQAADGIAVVGDYVQVSR